MNRNIAFAVTTLFSSLGCGGLDDALRARAASDLSCSPQSLQSEEVGQLHERVTCDGKTQIYYQNTEEEGWVSAVDRASVELECETKDLVTKVIDNKTVAITGCNKKALYVLESELTKTGPFSAGMRHKWIRDDR